MTTELVVLALSPTPNVIDRPPGEEWVRWPPSHDVQCVTKWALCKGPQREMGKSQRIFSVCLHLRRQRCMAGRGLWGHFGEVGGRSVLWVTSASSLAWVHLCVLFLKVFPVLNRPQRLRSGQIVSCKSPNLSTTDT